MLNRHRKTTKSGTPIIEKPSHMRSISDTTTGSNVKSISYATLTSTPMGTNHPSSPTMLTHTSSIRSIPFMSSIGGSIAPYGTTLSQPGRQSTPPLPSNPANPEDIIRPYTLPPTHNPDTKHASGVYPVYDSPTAPPPIPNAMRVESYRPATPTQRARYNPPAYEESSGSSSGRPQHREKQLSTDTDLSQQSSRVNLIANITGTANVADVGSPSPPSAVYQGHRPQLSASRDERRQSPPTPTEASISGPDIA